MQEETIRDFVPKYCQTVAVNEDDELFIELEDLLREYFGFSLCLSYYQVIKHNRFHIPLSPIVIFCN